MAAMIRGAARHFRCLLAFCLVALSWSQAEARSWADLDEGEVEIYGREREEKLPIRLFFVQREKWENHDALHILWLYGYKEYPRYRSNRVLPFWYHLESRIDNRQLTWTPVSWQETDGQSNDSAWFWLYYSGRDSGTNSRYSAFFPFYYHEQTGGTATSWVTPLFWYSREQQSPIEAANTSYGFPLVPLVMGGNQNGVSDLTIFYIFRNRTGNAPRSHLLPLWYYAGEQNGYLLSLLTPVFWYGKDQDSSWLLIIPLWYSHHSPRVNKTISPLCIHAEDANSLIDVFIPLWLSYREKNYNLHINALGISLAEEQFSALPFAPGIAGDRIYADWDFGWFYNLFHLASRTSIAGPAPAGAVPAPAGATSITHRRQRSRADSESFFGVYTFFGALAYERADHYRHFRLLPLSWLTWDSRSDTGLQAVIPFYVHYRDPTSRYLVIAPLLVPFYAAQETTQQIQPASAEASAAACRSNKQAWLLIAYIDEWDCTLQEQEQTIIWPIFNRYQAPARNGFRVFPVFWYKSRQMPMGKETWHFSPLHYASSYGGNSQFITWPFYSFTAENGTSLGTWGIWHIGRHRDAGTTYVFPVWYRSWIYPDTGQAGEHRDSLLTVAALWWRYAESENDTTMRGMQISPLYYYGQSPGRSSFYSWIWYSNTSESVRRRGIPLLWNRTLHVDETYSNFYLFPYYHSTEKFPGRTESYGWLLPVWYSRSDEVQNETFIAGYWYERRPAYAADNALLLGGRIDDSENDSHSRHALLYTVWWSWRPSESNTRLLYGMLFSRTRTDDEFSWHFALLTGYRYARAGQYRRHHFLPLYWHSVDDGRRELYLPALLSMFSTSADGNARFEAVLLGLLWYNNSDERAYEQTAAVGAGTVWFHNRTAERRFDSYGSLYGLLWHYETETNYRRLAILTFLYIRTETEKGVRHRILGIPL